MTDSSSFFNPEISINSGQMFQWHKINDSWYGVYGDHILKFSFRKSSSYSECHSPEYGDFEFYSYPELEKWESRLFRLDDDIEKILSGFSHDALVSEAIREYPGLRLLRQEPHQCMFSFVCANNTSITMIRRMLSNLSRKFGSKVIYDGKEFFTFPTANTLHRATVSEICACGLGYRSTSIKALAKSLVREELDVKHLMRLSYEHAKEHLMEIHGIGNKIADCILLFSLEKLEAFPIDIWITRALFNYYGWLNQNKDNETIRYNRDKITPKQYTQISETIRRYFGKYAGYAQQFLFYHMREEVGREW